MSNPESVRRPPPSALLDEAAVSSQLNPAVLRASAGNDATNATPKPKALAHPPEFLMVDELATLLRVNRKTVYEALARGEIPGARRIGGAYRISRDAVLRWFASGQDGVSRSRRNR